MFDFGEKHSHFCRTAREVYEASLIGKWGGLVGDSEKSVIFVPIKQYGGLSLVFPCFGGEYREESPGNIEHHTS